MKDDIEILDVFNEKKESAEPIKKMSRVELNNKNNNGDRKKKVKVKTKAIQVLFCSISALFILGCIVFYGIRFIKYYRIYNPKSNSSDGSVLLARDIVGKSEFATDDEDGLFSSGGSYIYKGLVKNNYLKYNNMLWRIVRINADNSLDIILDDYISILPWNDTSVAFKESEIYHYLNHDFLDNIDKTMLISTSFCEDEIKDLGSITCEKQNSNTYVKLLDVTSFLNSVHDNKSYLVESDEILWLSDYGDNKVWHTNGANVSQSEANAFYEIRPMVRLKSTTVYSKGNGTQEDPYEVDNSKQITVGSHVLLGEDKWIVYDITSDVKLMKEDVISKQIDFDKDKLTYKDSSLMQYLNGEYLDSLSYKDMLTDTTWYIGSYKNKLSDIKTENIKTKVGIPNILDIKIDGNIKSYFTSTIKEERVLVYENPLRESRITTYRSVRPCIALKMETAKKLIYQDGIFKVGE